jgi:hypothetical protein
MLKWSRVTDDCYSTKLRAGNKGRRSFGIPNDLRIIVCNHRGGDNIRPGSGGIYGIYTTKLACTHPFGKYTTAGDTVEELQDIAPPPQRPPEDRAKLILTILEGIFLGGR